MVERYKYILQQIHTINENVYRFLAIYQTSAVAIASAGLALFVGYRSWRIDPATARSGLLALMWLETVVAAFTIMLITIGIVSWLDYRREECELTDEFVRQGFRKLPQTTAFIRWYETYILLFIICSTIFMWVSTLIILLPGMT
ncbi:hypothetical protein [Nonomuraea sp. LPB2021202275-12-8]|uniref:hypothetical protein n=1 Tax=Nonomuraea sp. LPB2021202275-12-8 TaxID=3120159 RepID=UPI00300C6A16